MTSSYEFIEPIEIELKRADSCMVVQWNDGHVGRNTFLTLRWNCPCAGCAGEMGSKGRLDIVQELKADEYVLESLAPIGLYALRPVWKDGHDTGLYTYDWLRALCECDKCMAENPGKFQKRRLLRG